MQYEEIINQIYYLQFGISGAGLSKAEIMHLLGVLQKQTNRHQ